MALFEKNPNEVSYSGEKKHWCDVIKNTGAGELLIWRQPEEDFNTNSTLIVMPGEEAVFIKSGTVEQVFPNGTYQLSTENYPFISRLRNAFTGGISTFNCVVYFVRKAHSMEILWGTDSPIQVRDKLLGIATKIKARGSYKVQVSNAVQFLEKLIGNNIQFQLQAELNRYFFSEFQSKIKSVIARTLIESNAELLGIDARLDELSETIEPFMQEILEAYGLRCIRFTVASLDLDDDELRRKYDEMGIDAIGKLRNAQADKGVMDILGDAWEKQQAANIMGKLVESPGGAVATAGAGIGMGIAAGGVLGGMAQQVFAPMQQAPVPPPQPTMAGTSSDGVAQKSVTTPCAAEYSQDPVAVLSKLKKMLDAGLIEEAEYIRKKLEILNRM